VQLRFHPVANIFPLMKGEEFDKLVESIRTNGLLNPIWLHPDDGSVIDGKNRYNACPVAGVEPRYETWAGKGSLVAFVVAQNRDRRHLSATDRALLGKELLPLIAAKAKERMRQSPGRPKKGQEKGTQKVEQVSRRKNESLAAAKAAKLAGTNRQYISDLLTMERDAPTVYAKVKNREIDLREAKQEIKEQKKQAVVEQIKQETKPLPDGPFRVQAVDPPWRYESRADDITHRARNPYPDMTIDEIKALPVARLAHPDSIVWLWSPNAFMRQAFEILDAWGFENKTILTWVKDKMGTGHWLRGKTEHCLMAIKGKPVIRKLTNQTTALSGPLREHSRKPNEFYALVDSLCPGNKAEWFAREARENWTPIMSGELGKF
jgi:N6-adenosine-specific RNA methylase IME4